jgi:hypothetical protein
MPKVRPRPPSRNPERRAADCRAGRAGAVYGVPVGVAVAVPDPVVGVDVRLIVASVGSITLSVR